MYTQPATERGSTETARDTFNLPNGQVRKVGACDVYADEPDLQGHPGNEQPRAHSPMPTLGRWWKPHGHARVQIGEVQTLPRPTIETGFQKIHGIVQLLRLVRDAELGQNAGMLPRGPHSHDVRHP